MFTFSLCIYQWPRRGMAGNNKSNNKQIRNIGCLLILTFRETNYDSGTKLWKINKNEIKNMFEFTLVSVYTYIGNWWLCLNCKCLKTLVFIRAAFGSPETTNKWIATSLNGSRNFIGGKQGSPFYQVLDLINCRIAIPFGENIGEDYLKEERNYSVMVLVIEDFNIIKVAHCGAA